MAFLLRAALTGFALWIVTFVVSGIDFVGGDTTLQRVGIILVVAVVFGLVNAIIKPIVQLISIPLYILTLGLFHVVINALMLWITSWITENTTHWGLYIDDFWWTAIWAAIVLSIVSWALSLIAARAWCNKSSARRRVCGAARRSTVAICAMPGRCCATAATSATQFTRKRRR